jgi:putative oxidoreductase
MARQSQTNRMAVKGRYFMSERNLFYASWAPRFLSLLRIITGFLFIQHGAQKLFGLLMAGTKSSVDLFSLLGFAGVLEFFGGILILLGLFTRLTAFILSGQMAVAYFMVHAPQGFWPILNHGELAVLYCFIYLYLAIAGGGSWSLDNCCKYCRQMKGNGG